METNILNRRLKDHQAKALHHLISVQNGANFSVPGSGKTTVVLCAYEKYRLEGSVNVLFVVGPPACFGPWREEFKNVLGRAPKHIVLAGGNKADRKSEYYNSIFTLFLAAKSTKNCQATRPDLAPLVACHSIACAFIKFRSCETPYSSQ